MEESILKFAAQFAYQPKIENEHNLIKKEKFILLGMGGSHLAADLLKAYDSSFPILIHWDYGLPPLSDQEKDDYLIIISSHSGNTAEVIDGLKEAMMRRQSIAIISAGGELINLAQKHSLPYIHIPDPTISPRMAIGLQFKALLALTNQKDTSEQTTKLQTLKPLDFKKQGEKLAQRLNHKIPLIYSSRPNSALAYNWKIKFNETGKIPAFYNIFPELNHNEIAAFDSFEATKKLTDLFYFLFIYDDEDSLEIRQRMDILLELYRDKKYPVEIIKLNGNHRLERLFNCLLLADWTAYTIARQYNLEPEAVPLIENFKEKLTNL